MFVFLVCDSCRRPLAGHPVEIQAGRGLELERPLDTVYFSPHDDEQGHEADALEISAKFIGVPT